MRKHIEKLVTNRIILLSILSLITIMALIMTVLIIGWQKSISSIPKKQVFLQESFEEIPTSWETLGAEHYSENINNQVINSIKLSSKEFLAPHLSYILTDKEIPSDSFVLSFRVNVSNFTDNALTLCSLNLPVQPIVLIVDQEGRLGISHTLFSEPIYVQSKLSRLKMGDWQEIHLDVDGKGQQITIYLNNKKIFSEKYGNMTYPLQEIWLGTFWVKGSSNFGVPLDLRFDDVILGNEGNLPKLSFRQYLSDLISE